jgi:hypothetical protein
MTIHLKPEQERIIQEEILRGHFRDVEEVLDRALAALLEAAPVAQPAARSPKNLVAVLSEPPFAGSELDLERQRDNPRPVNL